ncbi:hypothetical protein [uncultured Gimesia sp.]|uniref:hypothetical protein n=1 Tax=uncultured Gimesia sp. TaxID=1678688 RepID=UPI0030DC2A52|tara:strand:- start:49276 stop:50460 length:1185 start_codon:yes stop_codon:yes gene_type:complete
MELIEYGVIDGLPHYFASATDEYGKRELHSVYAEDSQQAYEFFEVNGYVDIVLHSNDASAVIDGLSPDTGSMIDRMLPLDLMQNHYQTIRKLSLALLKRLYWKLRWILAVVIGFLLLFQWNRGVLGNTRGITVIAILLLLPALVAYLAARFSVYRRYKQLLDAAFWGRWQEVLDQIPRLEGMFPEYDLDARAAVALSALGRLDEGLELMQPYADSSRVPRWIYWSRLADLYFYANDEEQIQNCVRLAAEDAPELPIVKLGHAHILIQFTTEYDRAKQLLEQTEKQHLDQQCKLSLQRFKGNLELKLGNYQGAKEYFLVCQQGIQELLASQPAALHMMQPGMQLDFDVNQAYFAIALAELGDRAQAEEMYQQALPRLQALGYQRIMDRYAKAIRS